ncbi:hypothetical protein BJ878DRAFT_537588 [Calycina marina]|uniref:PH domain-containing protein n=1 Tax=Calycina marina TaxID=1763456 RepID=A0A9P7ZC36_9HELO|nr:hypothetical protein BJ878DRAFT_537588 [Calycina marina]
MSVPKEEASNQLHATDSAPQHGGRFTEDWDASVRGGSIVDGPSMQRSGSAMSQGETLLPSRGGTLKKKASLKRGSSLRRSVSRRSSRAGSVRSLALQPSGDDDEIRSAFFSPVPTAGNPTEILANRFQAWRKVLKDLITYFKEIQGSYEHKSKSLLKVSNTINNTQAPTMFLASGGIDDALHILREYHKTAITEANKSRDIENDVILALTGLRSDLSQKIKEIKTLSGDFKNSVEKEMDATRRAVKQLQEGLGQSDVDPATMTGRQDPYLLKLAVDRQVERQIDEENYLHQAYLNLEASGRELEAIIVGEIQKSYNAYAGILRREADGAYAAIEELRTGPITMPKDHEWKSFVEKDDHFVDPSIPVREAQYISYPGRDSELAQEVRAGLLERKGKYLKSYTAGWYVLSPTHLHEFKSADKTQAPIMSLYLPEQKLGSHSNPGSSSNKFILKGRQTGSLHRGHSWVFRAESHDTMIAWFEDVKALTEKSPQERNAFVRQHARSFSGNSGNAASVSSDGFMDEEDEEPFSTTASAIVAQGPVKQDVARPQGGKFPSELSIQRGLQAPLSPSSGSSDQDCDVTAAATNLPGSGFGQSGADAGHGESPRDVGRDYAGVDSLSSPNHANLVDQYAKEDNVNPYTNEPLSPAQPQANTEPQEEILAATGLGGAAVGVVAMDQYQKHAEKELVRDKSLAEVEAANVAAPDVPEQFEEQAAREATEIAAPDTLTTPMAAPSEMSLGPSTVASTPTESTRLSLASQQNESKLSISQLHVPGEYPKSIP